MGSAEKFLCEVLSPLVSDRVYPFVQPIDKQPPSFPSIVYYAVGSDNVATLQGVGRRSMRMRIDCRTTSYGETIKLADSVKRAIHSRLSNVYNEADDFDEDFKVYRRILTVGITSNG